MQNKSKLSKQKNLRATVSESLPGKSPDLRLQTDRHTCGPDRARGHPGGLGLGDRTKTRHPRESDRPRFLRQPLQAGRGKQKNRLQRPSRHSCRAQDPTKRTKRLRTPRKIPARRIRRNGLRTAVRIRSVPDFGPEHRATSGTVSEAKHRITKKNVYLNIPS